MRILIVCPFYPPENAIAAVRIAKFAEHWAVAGHEVRVLARAPINEGLNEPITPRLTVHRSSDPLARGSKAAVEAATRTTTDGFKPKAIKALKQLTKALLIPDVYAPWALRAWRDYTLMPDSWRPDVVVASVGPLSAAVLGASLARRFKASFVVDYRDLLASGPYYEHGRVRRFIDGHIERSAVSSAAVITAVSRPIVEDLRRLFKKPTHIVSNGYDPKDFERIHYAPSDRTLHIVHCGTFYPGKRDPEPLFSAIRLLLDDDPSISISVELYGRNGEQAISSARETGIEHVVTYRGEVDHATSLRLQTEADLLLLVLWNDPREVGVLSGKLFEYLGSRRPILMLGLETGAAAELLRSNDLGFVSNAPREISAYLRQVADEKRRNGQVQAPPATGIGNYTRQSQSEKFLALLQALLDERTTA